MRVGLATFHFNYNYGAVLQTYASCAALRQMGHEVAVINWIPPYFRPDASHWRGLGLRSGRIFTALPNRLRDMPRRLAFDRFRNRYIPLTEPLRLKDLGDLHKRFDAILVGSDQVWNTRWMHSYDGFYFLDFVPESAPVKRIGWAACFGRKDQQDDRIEKAAASLRRFHQIGVRNQMSFELVEKLTGNTPTTISDPTFLHHFDDIVPRRSRASSRSIVVYSLSKDGLRYAKDRALSLKKLTNGPVIFIATDKVSVAPWADIVVGAADPKEWVRLIAEASTVVTDSFHGSIFALKFGTPLHAYSAGWRSERLRDLFGKLGVMDRYVEKDDHISWTVNADQLVEGSAVVQSMRELGCQTAAWLDQILRS